MKQRILDALAYVDRTCARRYLALWGDRPSLVVLLFHSLFADRAEVEAGAVAPQQGITLDHFEHLLRYFLAHGYAFTQPDEILGGLDPGRRYVLLTFDDGYYNNVRALPLLHRYGVPALFFISTEHVVQQKGFWWDVLHRHARRAGTPARAAAAYKRTLKTMRTDAIEAALRARFGAGALAPTGDTDRPLTPAELADFSREPLVHIGNHTADHAILTNYAPEEVHRQIRGCQEALLALTHRAPVAISYPNGSVSEAAVAAARQEGLRLGITGVTGKNYLPLVFDGRREMRLGRMVPYGRPDLTEQCHAFRADFGLYPLVKNSYQRSRR